MRIRWCVTHECSFLNKGAGMCEFEYIERLRYEHHRWRHDEECVVELMDVVAVARDATPEALTG